MGATKQAMLEEVDREEAKKTAECVSCGDRFVPERACSRYCDRCIHMLEKDD